MPVQLPNGAPNLPRGLPGKSPRGFGKITGQFAKGLLRGGDPGGYRCEREGGTQEVPKGLPSGPTNGLPTSCSRTCPMVGPRGLPKGPAAQSVRRRDCHRSPEGFAQRSCPNQRPKRWRNWIARAKRKLAKEITSSCEGGCAQASRTGLPVASRKGLPKRLLPRGRCMLPKGLPKELPNELQKRSGCQRGGPSKRCQRLAKQAVKLGATWVARRSRGNHFRCQPEGA